MPPLKPLLFAAARLRLRWIVLPMGLLLSGCAILKPASPKGLEYTATAYSHGKSCNGPWAGRNAIGQPLKSGSVNSAAADWSRLPLGTLFRVRENGKVYIVDDYGSAMVGRDKVDLYKTNYRAVYNWGVRRVTLDILRWGDSAKSLEILKPRSKYTHVKSMVSALEKGGAGG
jgi:3D (Asp-Asp-Asp) domain-containing protein